MTCVFVAALFISSGSLAPPETRDDSAPVKVSDASDASDTAEAEIDPSKPTNFYSLLEASFEGNWRSGGGNRYGLRMLGVFAPNEAHLVLLELPILYNERSNTFGVGDLRTRYFWLPYKNYERVFGALGPSIDLFWPLGDLEAGLGSGRFMVSPGLTMGLIATDWVQFFPIVSYSYSSKPLGYAPPPGQTFRDHHGLTFQVVIPVVPHEMFFVQITPIYSLGDFRDARASSRYIQEILAQVTLGPVGLSAFYRGAFQDKDHTFRIGAVFYFF